MKPLRFSFKPCILFSLLILAGCDRYLVTLNDQTISEPRGVITSVDVADSALRTCIEQTLKDRKIRATDQLTTLICTHAGIQNLEGIQVFTKLEILNLGNNALTSIGPLLFLGNLASVNLEGNSALDCGEISALREHLPRGGTLIAPAHCS